MHHSEHICCRFNDSPSTCKCYNAGFDAGKKEEKKNAWLAPCEGCPEGHPTFWKTVVESPQWQAWEKEQHRRISHIRDKNHEPVFDIDECRETNVMSQEHFQEFIKFIRKDEQAQ